MDSKEIARNQLRRRLNVNVLKDTLDSLLYESEPCGFTSVGEFISEYCDVLKDVVIDFLDIDVTPTTKDLLYHYMVDNFGDYLYEYHVSTCKKKKPHRLR
jgi:hypothetical protein